MPALKPDSLTLTWRLVPRSLATQTLVTLLTGLILVQGAGLTIHALDRIELQRNQVLHTIATRSISYYRAVGMLEDEDRPSAADELSHKSTGVMTVDAAASTDDLRPTPAAIAALIKADMSLLPMPAAARPRQVLLRGDPWADQRVLVSLQYGDRAWLNLSIPVPPPRPWHSTTFLVAFAVMTVAAALLSFWAVRRLTGPVATLAAAAELLGRDVNAPPLPEDGPDEVARAASAFNTMAARIRRFVLDRTLLLTAIGHDLRTPITRLKLRAEFLEDDAVRDKFLADLDELDRMVSATLAFGRDTAAEEPAVRLDLMALLRTVLDDAADAFPDSAENLRLAGPENLTISGRFLPLKRAFTNLIGNAIKYGGGADVMVSHRPGEDIRIVITDDGPGVPSEYLERVFDPFFRVEPSRNRDTGGTGLGLSIARNILRAHGGDASITNAQGRGAEVSVFLPAGV